jgi:hypothetical protein
MTRLAADASVDASISAFRGSVEEWLCAHRGSSQQPKVHGKNADQIASVTESSSLGPVQMGAVHGF